jgi:hypothetical protein
MHQDREEDRNSVKLSRHQEQDKSGDEQIPISLIKHKKTIKFEKEEKNK